MRPRHVGVSLENRPKAAYTVSCREFLDRVGAHRLSTTQTFTPTVNTWTFDPTANPIKVCASDSLKRRRLLSEPFLFYDCLTLPLMSAWSSHSSNLDSDTGVPWALAG